MSQPFKLAVETFAVPVKAPPGTEVRLKGFYVASDGSIIDAATTTWPEGAPGGQGIDPNGFVDFAGSGFHLSKRDPVTHEVVAIATGQDAPACAAAGVKAPCLAMRTTILARSRLMTRDELRESMKGEITVEVMAPAEPPPPAALAPVTDALASPIAIGAFGVMGLGAVCALGWVVYRRRKLSPEGKMRELAARVSKKLKGADAVLFAALDPIVKKTLAAMRERRVDPTSKEGIRVADVLTRVEARLDQTAREEKEAKEQAAADELVLEMESALEAANEAARL